MKDRYILHCDCNGFFASVELLKYPELWDKPVAVGGDSETRHGIVLAKNEAAKKYGIKTAETLWQARKKCPDLIVLPPHHREYSRYSKIINGIYVQYTDLVEPFGIDESWLCLRCSVTASMTTLGLSFSRSERNQKMTFSRFSPGNSPFLLFSVRVSV